MRRRSCTVETLKVREDRGWRPERGSRTSQSVGGGSARPTECRGRQEDDHGDVEGPFDTPSVAPDVPSEVVASSLLAFPSTGTSRQSKTVLAAGDTGDGWRPDTGARGTRQPKRRNGGSNLYTRGRNLNPPFPCR